MMSKRTESVPPPPGWAEDELSILLDTAHHNTYATFVRMKTVFNRLRKIDAVYRTALGNLHHSEEWFCAFFFLRAHAAYLSGIRLAVARQCPEAYVVLRSCLEYCLYGLYLWKNPDKAAIWLKRHESEMHKKKIKDEFTIGTMRSLLEALDKKTGAIVGELYERTIDFGGHPNEKAILSNLERIEEGDAIRFDTVYLGGDSPAFRLCLKTCAQVGIAGLLVFYNIFRIRFDLLDLPDQIDRLKRGL